MLKIEKLDTLRNVYDLTVADNHNFFANNILVHNCTEIALYTSPMAEEDSQIALCTLAAINWGKFSQVLTEREEKILKDCCQVLVRGIDSVLSYQEYPNAAAKLGAEQFRPLGIGIIGFAHWLAKSRLSWGAEDTLVATENLMEKMAYYLTETSIETAKEFGPCPGRNKYQQGIFPIDTSKIKCNTKMNWDSLKEKAKKYGIRNATLTAIAPTECQSYKNKLNLSDGRQLDFHELLSEQNIDFEKIESTKIPVRLNVEPFNIKTQFGDKEVNTVYYNGFHKIYKLTFDDGNSYDFTGNHLIKVIRDTEEVWCRVDMLQIDDDILSV